MHHPKCSVICLAIKFERFFLVGNLQRSSFVVLSPLRNRPKINTHTRKKKRIKSTKITHAESAQLHHVNRKMEQDHGINEEQTIHNTHSTARKKNAQKLRERKRVSEKRIQANAKHLTQRNREKSKRNIANNYICDTW